MCRNLVTHPVQYPYHPNIAVVATVVHAPLKNEGPVAKARHRLEPPSNRKGPLPYSQMVEGRDLAAAVVNHIKSIARPNDHGQIHPKLTGSLTSPPDRPDCPARGVINEQHFSANQPTGHELAVGQPTYDTLEVRVVIPEAGRISRMSENSHLLQDDFAFLTRGIAANDHLGW